MAAIGLRMKASFLWRVDWLAIAVWILTIVVLALFLAYPIGKTALYAFVGKDQPLEFGNLSLVNFERFLTEPIFATALKNTVMVAALTTALSTVLALPAAYALARVAVPYRNVILALSVIPLISPPFIGAYSWTILLGRQGIITYYLDIWIGIHLPPIYGPFGIILALSMHYFPYVFLFVQGALTAADPFIEESAIVMGARRFRIMRTITFPLILPSIGAGALVVFVAALGNFGVPAILGGEFYVLSTLIYIQINGFYNFNAAAAVASVNVGIALLALLVLTRVMRKQRFVTVTGVSRAATRHSEIAWRIVANAYIWLLLLFSLLPQITIVFTSFAERWAGTLFPAAYGFANYARMLGGLRGPTLNSIILAGGATVLAATFGTLAAYITVRKRFFGKWALDLTIMLPFVLPGIVTGVAYLTTFNSGPIVLTGSGLIMVLAYFVSRLAYAFRAATASIGQVDVKIEEASTICGATWGHTMRRITVPLIAPGILAGGIIVFSTLVAELNITVLLYSVPWRNLSIAMFEQLIQDRVLDASAIGTVAIGLTLVLVFAASKLIGKTMANMFR